MLDGYDNPDPTLPLVQSDIRLRRTLGQPERDILPVKPLSERILSHIEKQESKGAVPRHRSFVIVPDAGIWKRMGHRTFYRLYGLHYFSKQDDPKTQGLQKAFDTAHSRIYLKDGTYVVASIAWTKNNLTFEGESWGAQLQPSTTTGDILQITGNAIRITNLLFNSPLAGGQTAGAALNFQSGAGGARSQVDHVRATNLFDFIRKSAGNTGNLMQYVSISSEAINGSSYHQSSNGSNANKFIDCQFLHTTNIVGMQSVVLWDSASGYSGAEGDIFESCSMVGSTTQSPHICDFHGGLRTVPS